MKQYNCYLIRLTTLEKTFKGVLIAESLDEARAVCEARYLKSGYFIGIERKLDTL